MGDRLLLALFAAARLARHRHHAEPVKVLELDGEHLVGLVELNEIVSVQINLVLRLFQSDGVRRRRPRQRGVGASQCQSRSFAATGGHGAQLAVSVALWWRQIVGAFRSFRSCSVVAEGDHSGAVQCNLGQVLACGFLQNRGIRKQKSSHDDDDKLKQRTKRSQTLKFAQLTQFKSLSQTKSGRKARERKKKKKNEKKKNEKKRRS
jgi:hypothetical protein